jgi:hypothetical protein
MPCNKEIIGGQHIILAISDLSISDSYNCQLQQTNLPVSQFLVVSINSYEAMEFFIPE